MEDRIEVNLMYKLNFLFTNLPISYYLVAQETDKLKQFLTSHNSVKNGEDEVIRFDDGQLFQRMRSL